MKMMRFLKLKKMSNYYEFNYYFINKDLRIKIKKKKDMKH